MADTTANFRVNVTSTGDESLAKNAAQTAASYKSVEASLAKAAGASARMARPSSAARQAAAMENQEYGMARGTAGTTGAAGRDFANQAQGLGGLVHLYATFAANIFAAGAAFRALSTAMDTTNMVKGLDQLGAASGRNLGYLSKQLMLTTDNAVSMREAMEATAKASSAGLSNDQIIRLGGVAKSASQALGVAMPDALSRLSRGISKIEPELLDELGIFVKVDKAVQEYARTMGRTATSLSDFERRQAYAIAVLKEGEQKFSDISLSANSYSKLLASLINVAQKLGETFNVVLGPIAKILAENSTLLAAALAGVVGLLLNKAIPAMGQWRANLVKTAQQASKTATDIENSFGERFVQRTLQKFKVPELQADVTKIQKTATIAAAAYTSAFEKAMSAGLSGKNTKIINALTSDQELGTREVKSIENRIRTLEKAGNVEAVAAGKELLRLNQQKLDLKQQEIKATQALKSVENAAFDAAEKKVGRLSEEWQRMAIARRAASKAASLNILAEVNQATREGGVVEGFKALRESISGNRTLSGIDKFKTSIKGAFVIATGAVTTFLSAVAPWLQLIGLIVAALPVVYSWLTKTAKEAEDTAKAIDALTSSTENLGRTLDNIAKKDPLGQLSIGSALAKNTALIDLGDSISSAIDKAFKQLDKISVSTFDSWINWIKKLWGGDVQSVLNESLAESISTAYKALGSSSADMVAKEELKKLLKYTGEDAEGIEKALNAIGSNKGAFQQVAKGAEELSKKARMAVANLTALRESQDAADKSLKDFLNSFLPSDNLSKFGQNVMDVAINLRNALNDPRTSTEALLAAFNKLEIFSPQVANSMASIGEEVRKLATEYKLAENQVGEYNTAITKQKELIEKLKRGEGSTGLSPDIMQSIESVKNREGDQYKQRISVTLEADKELQDLIEGKRKLEVEIIPNLGAKVEEYRRSVFKFTIDAFKQGADIVASRLNAEWAKAANVVTSGFASLFGDTKAGIILRQQAENRMIDAQMGAIRTQLELIKSNKSLEIQVQRNAIQLEKANIDKQLKETGVRSDERTAQLSNRALQLEKENAILIEREGILKRAETLGARSLARDVETLEKKKELNSVDENTLALLQEGIKYAQSIEGALAQMAQFAGQENINNLKTRLDLAKAETEEKKKINDIEAQQIKNNIEYLNTYSAITGPASIIVQQELNQLKISELLALNKSKQLDIEREIAYNTKLISELKSKASAGDTEAQKAIVAAEAYTKLLESQKQSLNATQANQIAVQEINNAAALTNKVYEERNRLQQIANKDIEDYLNFVLQLNANEMQLLETKKSFNVINETIYIQEKNRLEQLKLETEYARTINDIEKQRTAELDKVNKVIDTINDKYNVGNENATPITGIDLQILEQQYAERDRINKSYSTSITRATQLKNLNSDQLTIQKKLSLEAQKWEDLFKSIAASTASLAALFGEMGTKIGLATEAFAKLSQIIEQNSAKEQDAIQRLTTARQEYANSVDETTGQEDPKKRKAMLDAEKAYSDQRKKSAKDEMSYLAASAGAVKNMFKEKTAAYKTFAALEKALHVARLAMDAKELAATIQSTAASIGVMIKETAVSLGLMTAEGGAAVTKQASSGDPYTAFARAAAMAAFVTAVISAFGGKGGGAISPGGMSGMGSEQKQEVQGTGQTWQNGQIVNTGRGVYGDPTAKLETISKSLEIVRDKSINFLPLFDMMVMYLESIDRGINNTAKAIYSINLGKAFEGLNTSSDRGIIGSIFGGNKTQNLIDFGLVFGKAAGTTFADIFSGKAIQVFSTVEWKKSGGWFRKDKSGITESLSPLEGRVQEALVSIFDNATKTFQDIADYLGQDIDVSEALKSLNISEAFYLSIKDLKGEDLQTELGAVIGSILDEATYRLFGFAERFQEFGEDLFTTLIRIVDTNKKVTHALKGIGIDFERYLSDIIVKVPAGEGTPLTSTGGDGTKTGGQISTDYIMVTKTVKEQSIEITEALVEMAGGMEEFAKGINFYMENFLTQEEKRQLLNTQVSDAITVMSTSNEAYASTLNKAGVAAIDSVESFKAVVKAIDLTNPAGRELFTMLMDLAPAFYELYGGAEEAESKIKDLTAQLYRLQGRTDEAIAIEREQALAALKTEEEKSIQMQIFAEEDAAKIRKLNIELLQAEGKGYQALLLQREEELRFLTEAERVVKRQIYAAQDAAKQRSLEIQLLQAQGKGYEALIANRQEELKNLSPTEQRIRKLIWAFEDLQKTVDLNIRLATLQGNADAAIREQRKRELAQYKPSDQAILRQIYAEEDLAKIRTLNTELAEAEGRGYDALIMSRKNELRTLTAAERVIKKQIYAAQDAAKTQNLQIQLMRAMGNETGALAKERELELKNLSETDQEIQKMIWAYEDQKEATDKLKDSIQGVIDSLKENIKSLQDYKRELLVGAESPLTTGQKYEQQRSRIFDLLNIINTPAQTDEQKQAQSAAVSELQTVSTSFLDLSRKLFASSGQYNTDFNWILSIIDSATSSLEDQLTDAEKQLAATEETNVQLKTLNETALKLLEMGPSVVNYDAIDTTLTTGFDDLAEQLSKIVIGPLKVEVVDDVDPAVLEENNTTTIDKLSEISLSMTMLSSDLTTFTENLVINLANSLTGVSNILTSTGLATQALFEAKLTNLEAETANVTAAVINTNNNNTPLFQSMLNELRALNEKVTQLETVTTEMGLLNAEATKANTDELAEVINDSVKTKEYITQLQSKAMIA